MTAVYKKGVSRRAAGPVLVLLLAVVALATSVLFLRASQLPPVYLSAYRLLLAAVLLTPLFRRSWHRYREVLDKRAMLVPVVPGFLLAAHFVSWVFGARNTEVAHASLLVNMAPAIMPFLLFFVASEKVTGREILGTILAVAGVVVLVAADLQWNGANVNGDLICVGSTFLLAMYLTLGRRNRMRLPDVWLYVVPLYLVAGSACFLCGLVFRVPVTAPVGREILWVVALAVVPTILGHALINYCLRHLRGQLVAVVSLCQFIFAGLFEWMIFGNLPVPMFAVSALLVVGGCVAVILQFEKS